MDTVEVETGLGGVKVAGIGASDSEEEEEVSSEVTISGAVDGPGVGSTVAATG